MKLYYHLSIEYNLLIFRWNGTWKEEIYEKGFDFFKQIVNKYRIENVITDFRNAKIDYVYQNFEKFINRKSEINENYKRVYILNNPKLLVSVHMYAESLNKLNQNYFYCTTVKKAAELLSLQIPETELNKFIKSGEYVEL
jgi:hypothetical protein